VNAHDSQERRRATAFHEAGHAVYGLRLKPKPLRLLEATIAHGTVEPGKMYRGRCCWDGERTDEQQIELLLAGPVGEEYSGTSELASDAGLWETDDETRVMLNIAKHILNVNDDLAAWDQVIFPAKARVLQAFLSPVLQRELMAVAQALLDRTTLTDEEVDVVIASATRSDESTRGKAKAT
jgi:hypothetical protein